MDISIPTEKFAQEEAYTGLLNIMSFLLKKGANINAEDTNGWTALMHASFNHCFQSDEYTTYYLQVIRFLIENEADVLKKNLFQDTALTCPFSHEITTNRESFFKKYIAMANILLEKKPALLEIQGNYGYSPLTLMANLKYTN